MESRVHASRKAAGPIANIFCYPLLSRRQERTAASPQFGLANRCTDLTEVLLKEAFKTLRIVASTGFRESFIDPLPNRLVIVVEKLQSFCRVCHLPGYVCREGSASIDGMLDSRLMGLQRKFAPADKGIGPE